MRRRLNQLTQLVFAYQIYTQTVPRHRTEKVLDWMYSYENRAEKEYRQMSAALTALRSGWRPAGRPDCHDDGFLLLVAAAGLPNQDIPVFPWSPRQHTGRIL